MDLKNKKILIEGIGAIGGIISSRLLAVGYDCTLITGNKEMTKQIQSNGITEHIEDDKQKIVYPKHVYTKLTELKDDIKFDFALLAMKTDSVVESAKLTLPHLFSHGFVVTLQNGIAEEKVAEEIGEARIIGASMAVSSTMINYGEYKQTSPGIIFLGELNGEITSRIIQLKEILEETMTVKISENIYGLLWTKLAVNATVNPLGAISGQTWGEMFRDKPNRTLFLNVYSEVVDTAHANNITLEKITVNPLLLYMPKNAGFFTRFRKDIFLRIAVRKYKDTKPSTLQDLLKGKKTEIEYLNGFVVEKGDQAKIDTSISKYLLKMVKEIEDGSREIHPNNFDEVLSEFSIKHETS